MSGSTLSNNHLPVAPDSLNLTPTPSPLSLHSNAVTTPDEGVVHSPDAITIKEEESLSVGYSVSNNRDQDSLGLLTGKSSGDKSSSSAPSSNLALSSGTLATISGNTLAPLAENTLAPLSDISGLSGGSSVGSNVSLEILEVDSSLAIPKSEQEKSGENTTSSSISNSNSSSSLEEMAESKGSSPANGNSGAAGATLGTSEGVGRVGGGVSGMSWWTSAMAEADNVGDDLDAMVDKVEESTPKTEPRGVVGRQWHVMPSGRGTYV